MVLNEKQNSRQEWMATRRRLWRRRRRDKDELNNELQTVWNDNIFLSPSFWMHLKLILTHTHWC